MNKKFSTLMTAGLLMLGALFSSANAAAPGDAVQQVAGNKVKEFPGYYLLSDGTNGFLKAAEKTVGDTDFTVFDESSNPTEFADPAAVDDEYLWTIEPQIINGSTVNGFKFKSKKTGNYLTLIDGTAQPSTYTTKPTVDVLTWIDSYSDGFDMSSGAAIKIGSTNGLTFTSGAVTQTGTPTAAIKAYTLKDKEIEVDDLNGSRGSFSFKAAGIDNSLFGKNVKAFDVAEITTGFDGNNTNQEIPAGVYLATSWGDLTSIATYDDFSKCTFIAIDPNTSLGEKPADDIKAGKNLDFKEVKGSDFNFFTSSATAEQQSKNEEVSVANAAFKIETNSANQVDGNFSYAITTVDNIRFQPKAAEVKQITSSEPAAIAVVEINKKKVLTATAGADKAYTFTFGPNSISKVTRLLNANGASVYNISFESGKAEEEKGKYLGSGNDGSTASFVLLAQGMAVADLNTPQYQFVISAVDTVANEVTFTNREAGNTFTCVLDTTATAGVYNVVATTGTVKVIVPTLDASNEYVYTTNLATLVGSTIKLTPATVDKFAGFAVRDTEKDYVRMVFAKDVTAAQLYATVKTTASPYTLEEASNKEADAAMFELVQSEKPVLARHDYVMLDSKGAVKTMSLMDTVAYYTYNLKYVETPALATPYLLKENGGTLSLEATAATADHAFIIKENKDGSVSVMKSIAYNASAVSYDAATTKKPVFTGTAYKNADAADIKVFLLEESYGASLPAEHGNVSFESEAGGFVSMNANNDGVIAIKTAADEDLTFYLDTADSKATLPSFYISKSLKATKAASADRMYMYYAADSATYVGPGEPGNRFEWANGNTKIIFKAATLINSDTLATTAKGKAINVAMKADADGTQAGLDNFRFQIFKADDAEDTYVVRCVGAAANGYLKNVNGQLTLGSATDALKVYVAKQQSPVANEGINASEVSVIATDGGVIIIGAQGKKVTISNVLGQTIANTVITSDNATIAAPAGVVVVAVEGEAAVKSIVK